MAGDACVKERFHTLGRHSDFVASRASYDVGVAGTRERRG